MISFKRIETFTWEVPVGSVPGMRVPGVVYATPSMIEDIAAEGSLEQVANAATLPGIVRASYAMPDIHYGYGLPIGGVVATDIENGGVITPGGVGYDINCGVRLIAFDLLEADIIEHVDDLARGLFKDIPSGVGEGGAIRLTGKDLDRVFTHGAKAMVDRGFGTDADLEATESFGAMEGADPSAVSKRAKERAANQCGTLGSGNHFVELGIIRTINDAATAEAWGLVEGQVTMMVHTGSRGFGHQVATDHIAAFEKAMKNHDISIPDRQLACLPYDAPEAKAYRGAMACAANFAWANRQAVMALAVESIGKTLDIGKDRMKARLLYDVAHNILKTETHVVDGEEKRLAVHRKGATRALAAGHPELPKRFAATGQPVIIPGDMGRKSFILKGGKAAAEKSFSSACHGAGRMMSRNEAIRQAKKRDIKSELAEKGIVAVARTKRSLDEEMPDAYKDVSDVVDVVDTLGIATAVAETFPIAVIKG